MIGNILQMEINNDKTENFGKTFQVGLRRVSRETRFGWTKFKVDNSTSNEPVQKILFRFNTRWCYHHYKVAYPSQIKRGHADVDTLATHHFKNKQKI